MKMIVKESIEGFAGIAEETANIDGGDRVGIDSGDNNG